MESGEKQTNLNIYVVVNPVAGNSSASEIRQSLDEQLGEKHYTYQVHETIGEEDLAQLTRKACEQGADLVIAAGGDGTVAGVVNGLVHTGVPLGIIPVGTGNGLARALRIPIDPTRAIQLFINQHRQVSIDAMKINNHYYILNAGAGIGARANMRTPAFYKRRFGIFAYIWTILSEAFNFRPTRFNVLVDGKQMLVNATEILISNSSLLEETLQPLGNPDDFSDGILEVYIISARSLGHYLRMIGDLLIKKPRQATGVHHISVKRSIKIDAVRKPQPAQGDGELIGQTPLEVEIVPRAVCVIAPLEEK